MSNIILTIFTPAYNRAHTLPRTYDSLQKQTCKDFIWLIVDDGSSDNTADLVKKWIEEEKDFKIRYIYKENGGMHTAHNIAYENIDTELNVCIDSDDAMPEDAVELILHKWNDVKNLGYAGIIGYDTYMHNGKVIGKDLSGFTETTLNGYYAKGGQGDKKLVYRTDVINSYPPYPVFEDEKYVSLGYKYRLIDQDYKLAVLNKNLCNVDYQPDGSSNTMWLQYMKNPKGFVFNRKICMQYSESTKRLFMDCVHYVAESRIAGYKHYIKDSPKKLMTVVAIPVGLVLEKMIRKKSKA